MNLKYLKNLRPILNKVGIKHNIPVSEGEFIVDSFFKSFKSAITDPRVPKVKLPNFGTFQPKIKYIDRSLRMSMVFFQGGATTYEYIRSRFNRIWPVRKRLVDEYEGKVTWRDWYNKKVKKKFDNLVLNEQEEKRKSKEEIYGSVDHAEKQKDVFNKIRRRLPKKDRE